MTDSFVVIGPGKQPSDADISDGLFFHCQRDAARRVQLIFSCHGDRNGARRQSRTPRVICTARASFPISFACHTISETLYFVHLDLTLYKVQGRPTWSIRTEPRRKTFSNLRII